MKVFYFTCWLHFMLTLGFSTKAWSQNYVWGHYEILGHRSITREAILADLPSLVGTPYTENPELWQKWCEFLKQKHSFYFTQCSPLRYVDGKAYMVVDIVEKGEEQRTHFAPEPTKEPVLATPEILDLYDQLYARLWELFEQRRPPKESTLNGFLDYDDSKMHQLALQLKEKVPPHVGSLLRVLRDHKSAEKRAIAANLLNWCGIHERAVFLASHHLDDSNYTVRNNLSRYILGFIPYAKEEGPRQFLIEALAKQLSYPSHPDRNKALYVLLGLTEHFPQDVSFIKQKALDWIQYIAQNSLLENVKGPAQELLKKLKGP